MMLSSQNAVIFVISPNRHFLASLLRVVVSFSSQTSLYCIKHPPRLLNILHVPPESSAVDLHDNIFFVSDSAAS
jgi:hypothetical protein